MKLYAIEHPDGGKWWSRSRRMWVDALCSSCFYYDEPYGGAKRVHHYAKSHGGTVVTFTLTRAPELKVGARVVRDVDVVTVEEVQPGGEVYVDGCDAFIDADDLVVLPEEAE